MTDDLELADNLAADVGFCSGHEEDCEREGVGGVPDVGHGDRGQQEDGVGWDVRDGDEGGLKVRVGVRGVEALEPDEEFVVGERDKK